MTNPNLPKETLGNPSTEYEVRRLTLQIHCVIEIQPLATDIDLGFINSPRIPTFFK